MVFDSGRDDRVLCALAIYALKSIKPELPIAPAMIKFLMWKQYM